MILGTPEQEQALAKQLDCIFDAQPHAVLGGSLGRAAIYGQFGYDAVPLSLADPAHRVSGLRDIDLMFTDEHLFGMDDAGLARLGPHTVDTCLGAFIRRDQRGCGVLTAKDEDGRVTTFLLDPEVIRRVQRPFLGTKVWTFAIGTQCHLERLVDAPFQKYETSKRQFHEFAAKVGRVVAPEEFLPPSYYKPFEHQRLANRG